MNRHSSEARTSKARTSPSDFFNNKEIRGLDPWLPRISSKKLPANDLKVAGTHFERFTGKRQTLEMMRFSLGLRIQH
jgi:hypothetical protein